MHEYVTMPVDCTHVRSDCPVRDTHEDDTLPVNHTQVRSGGPVRDAQGDVLCQLILHR